MATALSSSVALFEAPTAQPEGPKSRLAGASKTTTLELSISEERLSVIKDDK
jgi:hypothetical protein